MLRKLPAWLLSVVKRLFADQAFECLLLETAICPELYQHHGSKTSKKHNPRNIEGHGRRNGEKMQSGWCREMRTGQWLDDLCLKSQLNKER